MDSEAAAAMLVFKNTFRSRHPGFFLTECRRGKLTLFISGVDTY